MKDIEVDNSILSCIRDNCGQLVPQRCSEKYLAKRGWYDYLKNRYGDNTTNSLREIIYRLHKGIEQAPRCKACGKELVFDIGNMMYPLFCSPKCRNNDPDVKRKNKEGVSSSLKKAYTERGEQIKAKRADTLREHFGEATSSPFSVQSIQDKARCSIIERYGVDNIMRLPDYHVKSGDAIKQKSVDLWRGRGLNISYTDHGTVIIRNGCTIHGDIELDVGAFNNRTHDGRYMTSEMCPICRPPYDFSGPELIIKKFLDGLGVVYTTNDRSVISPLELDFYIPAKHIAIEFNGMYYHPDGHGKDKNYHVRKTEMCEALGIQLIHVWEHDWIRDKDLILDMLKVKLGFCDKRIYARNCVVKSIDSKTYRKFTDKYHLQGSVPSFYKYGLYYGDELVSIMSFGKLRKSLGSVSREGTVELYRLCTKTGYVVVGGASKLLKYAINDMKGVNTILTYAKRDWSNGSIYRNLGFVFDGYTVPGYMWVNKCGDVYTRYSTRKDLIAKTDEDKNRTESEIMRSRGFYKCFDAGNLRFQLKI